MQYVERMEKDFPGLKEVELEERKNNKKEKVSC